MEPIVGTETRAAHRPPLIAAISER